MHLRTAVCDVGTRREARRLHWSIFLSPRKGSRPHLPEHFSVSVIHPSCEGLKNFKNVNYLELFVLRISCQKWDVQSALYLNQRPRRLLLTLAPPRHLESKNRIKCERLFWNPLETRTGSVPYHRFRCQGKRLSFAKSTSPIPARRLVCHLQAI